MYNQLKQKNTSTCWQSIAYLRTFFRFWSEQTAITSLRIERFVNVMLIYHEEHYLLGFDTSTPKSTERKPARSSETSKNVSKY